MKKLNSKGFTLVELLAVIIILAIVVGITIPAILTTTNNAKKKAFETAANSAADWIDRQYQVWSTGLYVGGDNSVATLDGTFADACLKSDKTGLLDACKDGTAINTTYLNQLITAAGLKTSNVGNMTIKINTSTGRSCVILEAKKDDNNKYIGDYAGAGNVTNNSNQAQGGSC